MGKKAVELLSEQHYAEEMKEIVEPYLAERGTVLYLEREPGRKIFCMRYLAEKPEGVILISHGYTETAEKYKEIIYYFVKAGYHVYAPEHCGHGRSYRLTDDRSLVHIDSYQRYVKDLLMTAERAKEENPELPLALYGHSMGGGIAAAAAGEAPDLFCKVILSSPMILPLSSPVPRRVARLAAAVVCCLGKGQSYLPGHHPYEEEELFEDSASASRERFDYYQEKRKEEPLYQTCAASYGWLNEAYRLNRFLQRRAWKKISCPVRLFQAEQDAYVSAGEQERFVRKMCRKKDVRLIRVPGMKHEIFNSPNSVLETYWRKIFAFLK